MNEQHVRTRFETTSLVNVKVTVNPEVGFEGSEYSFGLGTKSPRRKRRGTDGKPVLKEADMEALLDLLEEVRVWVENQLLREEDTYGHSWWKPLADEEP